MYFLLKQLSRLPMKVLYIISDIIYIILYRMIGYRKKIVRMNLSSSFPEKTEAELREIERKFYHWLCDYFVETLKLLTITPEEMKQHLEYHNTEELSKAIDTDQNLAVYLGHYCNWEWLSASHIYFPKGCEDVELGLIYHPLRNDTFDDLMLKARSRLGGTCIPKKNILREIVKLKKENRHYLFGYIFDQSPKWQNIHLWLDFLNRKTPVFTGAERISRKMNDRVVFATMERPKRGKYVCTYHLITANAKDEPEYEITKKCFEMLETLIKKEPHLYLWTHNRWKRTYEEYLERMKKKEETTDK